MKQEIHPGPRHKGEGVWEFILWAPLARSVYLELLADNSDEALRSLAMEPLQALDQGPGHWRCEVAGLREGDCYRFALEKEGGEVLRRADPASRSQPRGVHGPSALVDPQPLRPEPFTPPALEDMVIYELHVGAFTPEGDFDAAMGRLDHLAELGVNAVELMPLAQCPGERNWGYDGVYPYAVQHNFGGAHGLQRFVSACHARGLAVLLDVVYNHLGPEGNYLRDFAPYFTRRYATPWGEALNFDGPDSDAVRAYFLCNAWFWFEHFGIDGLRVDAVHAIHDARPDHFLRQLSLLRDAFAAHAGKRPVLIAESHQNDPRLTTPVAQNGLGMDAVWNDDFHHALHALVTGERQGYYADYGTPGLLRDALAQGFCYTGQYSAYRRRRHGLPAGHLPASCFVNWLQSHDMVGNRLHGERLGSLLEQDRLRLAAALLLLTPGVPMLFMGEEWGEVAPFFYFTSHGDPALAKAVREGRKREFAAFAWQGEPPDPQAPEAFAASRLDWCKTGLPGHRETLAWYAALLRLRHEHACLRTSHRHRQQVCLAGDVLLVERSDGQQKSARLLCVFNLGAEQVPLPATVAADGWQPLLSSHENSGMHTLAPAETMVFAPLPQD